MAAVPLLAIPMTAGNLAALPDEAEAAKLKTLKFDGVVMKAPAAWKKAKVRRGATYEVYYDGVKPSSTGYRYDLPLMYEGYYEGSSYAKGKPSIKVNKKALTWKLHKGGTDFYITVENVPYLVWQSAHKKGNYRFTKSQAAALLKMSTGGKITYAKLVKMSAWKAKTQGKKAVIAWVGKKVIATARFV